MMHKPLSDEEIKNLSEMQATLSMRMSIHRNDDIPLRTLASLAELVELRRARNNLSAYLDTRPPRVNLEELVAELEIRKYSPDKDEHPTGRYWYRNTDLPVFVPNNHHPVPVDALSTAVARMLMNEQGRKP